MQQRGLALPADYSAANALTSAWLTLQDVQNLDKKPIFANGQLTGVVTELSVVNALHDMVIQGLNPAKKQVYFIVYGQKLICQRGYFGDMAMARRVQPGIDFYFDTINEGDEFVMEKVRTPRGFVTTVTKHVQAFPRGDKLLGAYCGVIDADGVDLGADVFDMARIKKSWAMSKMHTVQDAFPADMALRTVIRHRCKPIINASNDAMLAQAIARQDVEAIDAEVCQEAAEFANGETLALAEPAAVVDAETGEVTEARELF
jgi:recombination protein RecT